MAAPGGVDAQDASIKNPAQTGIFIDNFIGTTAH